MNSPAYTLKPVDAVYHSALRFKTEDGFIMHRCLLYEKVGWQSHCILFIYKALLGKLTGYLSCLLNYKSSLHCTKFQHYLDPKNHHVNTETGKLALKCYVRLFFGTVVL